jgi:hypothetical protein
MSTKNQSTLPGMAPAPMPATTPAKPKVRSTRAARARFAIDIVDCGDLTEAPTYKRLARLLKCSQRAFKFRCVGVCAVKDARAARAAEGEQ